MRIPLACCLLALLMLLTYFFIFLLFLPFFGFDLDIVCFILSFSCGYYAVSSVSVSAATFSYYMIRILICIVRTLNSPFFIFV